MICEGEMEPYYIGIGNFAPRLGDEAYGVRLAAPVSGLFYDYDSGPAFYEAPAGRIEGEIRAKWQYKIKNERLIYAFESDTKIDDEILKEELGKNGDVRLKNIVRTYRRSRTPLSATPRIRSWQSREQRGAARRASPCTASRTFFTMTVRT